MKLLKIFCLSAIAAVASMAIVAVSPVMAADTALCKKNEDPCKNENKTNTIHLLAKDIKFKGDKIFSHFFVTCKESLIEGTVLALGAPQKIHITELTWTGCKIEAQSCFVIATKLGAFDLLKTVFNLGSVTSLENEIKFSCGLFIECTFGAEPVFEAEGASHTAGANNGMLTAKELELTSVKGSNCPATSKLSALYEPLVTLYISS